MKILLYLEATVRELLLALFNCAIFYVKKMRPAKLLIIHEVIKISNTFFVYSVKSGVLRVNKAHNHQTNRQTPNA